MCFELVGVAGAHRVAGTHWAAGAHGVAKSPWSRRSAAVAHLSPSRELFAGRPPLSLARQAFTLRQRRVPSEGRLASAVWHACDARGRHVLRHSCVAGGPPKALKSASCGAGLAFSRLGQTFGGQHLSPSPGKLLRVDRFFPTSVDSGDGGRFRLEFLEQLGPILSIAGNLGVSSTTLGRRWRGLGRFRTV